MPDSVPAIRRAPFSRPAIFWALIFWLAAGVFPAMPPCAAGAEPAAVRTASDSSVPPAELQLLRTRFTVAARQVSVDYQLGLKGLVPIRDQLRDGAHMTIEGGIRLLQRNLLRPNSERASLPLAWILRHDPLTREFLLADAVAPEDGRVDRSPRLDALLHDAWKELHAVLTPEDPLEDDETYIVRFDLVLKYAEVPPWLEKALFFWSWDLSPKFSFEHTFTWQEN